MLEYLLRFLAGGVAVSAFAIFGDMLRPKVFAGLFGTAPSIAVATLLITVFHDGAGFAAEEARSMALGALALVAYSFGLSIFLKKLMLPSLIAASAGLPIWFAVAFGLTGLLIGFQ